MPAAPGIRTTWVLGSGFSKALGGPLLADLFAPDPDLAITLPKDIFRGLADCLDQVQTIFNWGRDVERRWSNAEEFLHTLTKFYLMERLAGTSMP
jgi:hypothetical protein